MLILYGELTQLSGHWRSIWQECLQFSMEGGRWCCGLDGYRQTVPWLVSGHCECMVTQCSAGKTTCHPVGRMEKLL